MENHIIKVVGVEYRIVCTGSTTTRNTHNENGFNIKLNISVYEVKSGRKLPYGEIKGYLLEKLEDFIKNTVNGKPRLY